MQQQQLTLPPGVRCCDGDKSEGSVRVRISDMPRWEGPKKQQQRSTSASLPLIAALRWWGQPPGRGTFLRPLRSCAFPVVCAFDAFRRYLRDAPRTPHGGGSALSADVCNAKTLQLIGRAHVPLRAQLPFDGWVPVRDANDPSRTLFSLHFVVSFVPSSSTAQQSAIPLEKQQQQQQHQQSDSEPEPSHAPPPEPVPPTPRQPLRAAEMVEDDGDAGEMLRSSSLFFTPNPLAGRQRQVSPRQQQQQREPAEPVVASDDTESTLRRVLERGKRLLQAMDASQPPPEIHGETSKKPQSPSARAQPTSEVPLAEMAVAGHDDDDDASVLEELFFRGSPSRIAAAVSASVPAPAPPSEIPVATKATAAEEEETPRRQPQQWTPSDPRKTVLYVRISGAVLRPRPASQFRFEVKVLPGVPCLVSDTFQPTCAFLSRRPAFEGTVPADLSARQTLEHFKQNSMVIEVCCASLTVGIVHVPLHRLHAGISRVEWDESMEFPCVGFRGQAEVLAMPSLGPGGRIGVTVAAGTLSQVRHFCKCDAAASQIQRVVRRFLAKTAPRRRQEAIDAERSRQSVLFQASAEPQQPRQKMREEEEEEEEQFSSESEEEKFEETFSEDDSEEVASFPEPPEGCSSLVQHTLRISVSSLVLRGSPEAKDKLRQGNRFYVSYTVPPTRQHFRTQPVSASSDGTAPVNSSTKHTLRLPVSADPASVLMRGEGICFHLWRIRSGDADQRPLRLVSNGQVPEQLLRALVANGQGSSASESRVNVAIGRHFLVRLSLRYHQRALSPPLPRQEPLHEEAFRSARREASPPSALQHLISSFGRTLRFHVGVLRATGLDAAKLPSGGLPRVFVRCTLFPEVSCMDTPVAAASSAPAFDFHAVLSLFADDARIASHMESGFASFEVLHQDAAAAGIDGTTVSCSLGRVLVPLRDLLAPSPKELRGWFNVVSASGTSVGALDLLLALEGSRDAGTSSVALGWTVLQHSRPSASEAPSPVQQPSASPSKQPQQPPPPQHVRSLSVGILRGVRLRGGFPGSTFASLHASWVREDEPLFTSASVPSSASPFWGATTSISFPASDASPLLFVRIWSTSAAEEGDGPSLSKELLGTATVDLGALLHGMREIHGWYAVEGPGDEGAASRMGHIEVLAYLSGAGGGGSSKASSATGHAPSASCRCPLPREPHTLGVEDLQPSRPPQPSSSQRGIDAVAASVLAAVDRQAEHSAGDRVALAQKLQKSMQDLAGLHHTLTERCGSVRVSGATAAAAAAPPPSEFAIPPPPRPPAFVAEALAAASKRAAPRRPVFAPPSDEAPSPPLRSRHADAEVERIARIMRTSYL